mgnify:CR=1 FL=1
MSTFAVNTAGDLMSVLSRLDPRTPIYVEQPKVIYSSEQRMFCVSVTSKRGRKGAVPVAVIRA